MPNTTKRERDRRLDDVAQAVEQANDVEEDWTVEHRGAAPNDRPHGMAVDVEAREIAYDFWEAQQECLDLLDGEHDIVGFLGGYRSGKSVTGARWLLTQAIRTPGRYLAMGTTYSEAVETTYRVLFEQLPGSRTHMITSSFNGPEHSPLVEDYNRQEHRLTLVNDSVIVLGSADYWSRYAGDEYSAVWQDESSHYGDVLYDLLEMISTRLTADSGSKVQFHTLTGNGFNAAWSILEKQEDVDGGELGHTVELVRASVLDNPYIAQEDKDRLERQFEGGGREDQALHGGFSAAKGLVYSNFKRNQHVIEHDRALDDVTDWRMYGYDAGWNDPRVLLELGKTAYGQLVVLDEFYRSECHVEDAIEWLATHSKPSGTIYCEHVPDEIQKFRRAGWQAVEADKDIDSGIANVRQRFEEDDESGRVGLVISDQCENLIHELHSYKKEHVGTSAAVDHCADSLRYAIHTDGTRTGVKHRTPASAGKHSTRSNTPTPPEERPELWRGTTRR